MGKFDANEREINEALKKANLYDFVQSLPEKLQTNVGEGGSLLSGGQKQRLALARTIIKNPEIYIFDEATSNIDVESENDLMKLVDEMKDEKTILCGAGLSVPAGWADPEHGHDSLCRKRPQYRRHGAVCRA